jgi:hypothetical protein
MDLAPRQPLALKSMDVINAAFSPRVSNSESSGAAGRPTTSESNAPFQSSDSSRADITNSESLLNLFILHKEVGKTRSGPPGIIQETWHRQ